MPKATVRANARTLPEAERPPQPAETAEELHALAFDFEEADPATARIDEIARKIVALPTTEIEMMRLKARIYLWSEGTDFKTFAANNEGDGSSEAVLVSLFRDLGADRPIGSITAPATDPIFDSIEAHRKAWARIVDAHKNLEDALSKEAFTFELKARGSKVDDAKNELLKTPPATLLGAQAIIEYLIEWDEDCDPETSYKYLSTLIRSPIFAIAADADRVLAQDGEEVA